MAVNIDALLSLPQKERKRLAEQLWSSLSPGSVVTNEEREVIDLLEKRWKKIQSGSSKQYSPEQLKQMVFEHRNHHS